MRAGSLTERIILLEPVREKNPHSGATETVWRPHAVRYAEYRPTNPAQRVDADEVFGSQKATFLIRDFESPHEGWRLRHIGGMEYKIIGEPVRRRDIGMLTLTCERVNK